MNTFLRTKYNQLLMVNKLSFAFAQPIEPFY